MMHVPWSVGLTVLASSCGSAGHPSTPNRYSLMEFDLIDVVIGSFDS